MLSEYIAKKLQTAHYKLLPDDTYFGEIPGLKGVWANHKKLEACRQELKSALEDWILFKIKEGDSIPGLPIAVDRRRLAKRYA